MASPSKWHDGAHSTLTVAIEALNLAKEVSSVTPAKAVFGSVSVLLIMIRDSMANEKDYIELGKNCAEVCKALDRGLNGRRSDFELDQSVLEAMKQFTATVDAIQRKAIKKRKRNALSRAFHVKDDKDTIATWRQDLTRVLHIFNTELAINTNVLITNIHQKICPSQEGAISQQSSQGCIPPGESPPPAPRNCFGRNELIEQLVGFAENLEPVALIGAGGIGKTSIARTVLHHDRIKKKFGDNRRFIRCDQFTTSRAHFLARLSKVIGAEFENPEDLKLLHPFLSSHKIFIVLDNAESVLDPRGTDASEIYDIVNELCQFKTICVCITSRLTTVPPHCKLPVIPTLSIEAARDVFYNIHIRDGQPSCIIDDLLRRLDFHALSITLLATTASHNMWDYAELAKEWNMHRAQVLRTDYNESLAATIELSLASPTFRKLGAEARDLLGVVAFFPQGVAEKSLDSFFPGTSDRKNIFRTFRVLSLTHRSNGFITMLAPIRDYLCPQDPASSPLLCAVKDCYFGWLSVELHPDKPGFEEAQWIKSEDVNVEHLLDVFTSTPIDVNTDDIWVACVNFIEHLYWHKRRLTVLVPKINALPDNHPSKIQCLFWHAHLFASVGNFTEQARLLSSALGLIRGRGDDLGVASLLMALYITNRMLDRCEEDMQQAKEAIDIFKRLGNTEEASPLIVLGFLLQLDNQLDAAEDAISHAMKILPEKGQEYKVSQSHYILGTVYHAKGDREKAIHHFETCLGIASTFDWHDMLFCAHHRLVEVFVEADEFVDAQTHAEKAKFHASDDRLLGGATLLHAIAWTGQSRLEEARSEFLAAIEIFGRLEGLEVLLESSRDLLQTIEEEMQARAQRISRKSTIRVNLRVLIQIIRGIVHGSRSG